LIIIELVALNKSVTLSLGLIAPANAQAKLVSGKSGDINWQTRSFTDSVDIATEVAIASKTFNYSGETFTIQKDKKLIVVLAVESKFKQPMPLDNVINLVKSITIDSLSSVLKEHDLWWNAYWNKSTMFVNDRVLMKAYYQGLYTMAACSRDPKFPPGLFGWTTDDSPGWNGDYHLNYNFQASFYALYGANRLQQGEPEDAPLIDFMPRGEWYAKNVTHIRGILYPVGIGPLGIEVTRNFPVAEYQKEIEKEGLFFGQRSNAAYGLLNMAQQWRCTYDTVYGKKIYPYALAVANFWEDYLKIENGRYVIYNDAIHEGSGKDKNPILSLGLVRNVFTLIIDLSSALKIDENRQNKWKDILSRISEYPTQTRAGKKVFRYTKQGLDWWNDNGLGIQHIYPSNGITLDSSRELLQVARNTIDEMHRWQDLNTSNSFFVAAIRVGYDSIIILDELHKYAIHTYPNGFQLDNPHGIENSCTVANALNEMLCMSVGNVIRLFPVLPKTQQAAFTNIRAWGGFLVSANLKAGIVSNVKIVSEKGRSCTVVNPWPNKKMRLVRNGKTGETLGGNRISFTTSANEIIEINSL
jgi:alpha-L-fucosidase 2